MPNNFMINTSELEKEKESCKQAILHTCKVNDKEHIFQNYFYAFFEKKICVFKKILCAFSFEKLEFSLIYKSVLI